MLKKKKAAAFLSHSHSPLRFLHFLPMAFFRSQCVFLTSGNKGCFVLLLRFVCVTYFRTLSRKCCYYLHRFSRTLSWATVSHGYFCFRVWICHSLTSNEFSLCVFKSSLWDLSQFLSEVPHTFLSLKKSLNDSVYWVYHLFNQRGHGDYPYILLTFREKTMCHTHNVPCWSYYMPWHEVLPSNCNSLSNETRWNKQNSDG